MAKTQLSDRSICQSSFKVESHGLMSGQTFREATNCARVDLHSQAMATRFPGDNRSVDRY
jgi:hypothetical protein